MKRLFPLVLIALASTAQATAPGEKPQAADKMVTETITQPLSDVNLKKRDIPPILLEIQDDPYALKGVRNCRQLIAAVKELDSVLGPDFDQVVADDKGQKRRESVKSVASGFISSLIPFRALVREVSGANKAENQFREAIYAGVVRRGFLKGYGQHRRCRAPGRPLNDREQWKQTQALDAAKKEQDP